MKLMFKSLQKKCLQMFLITDWFAAHVIRLVLDKLAGLQIWEQIQN